MGLHSISLMVLVVVSGIGGLVVSMLASGIRVRRFKPVRSRWNFSGEKILSMPSFGWEITPFAPCGHVKEPCDYMEVGSHAKFVGQFSPHFFPW
jgi:hypothetical protein